MNNRVVFVCALRLLHWNVRYLATNQSSHGDNLNERPNESFCDLDSDWIFDICIELSVSLDRLLNKSCMVVCVLFFQALTQFLTNFFPYQPPISTHTPFSNTQPFINFHFQYISKHNVFTCWMDQQRYYPPIITCNCSLVRPIWWRTFWRRINRYLWQS